MNKQYSFTYIIPYKHSVERLGNLRRVLDWVASFSNSEIIVVEQDTHSKISHLKLPCRQFFLKTNMPFNKSWAFNFGLKHVNSSTIVFGDCDLIMNPDHFIEALRLLEKYDMVNPYSSVIDLDRNESNMPLEQLVGINRAGRGETDIQKVPLCGGICIFRKEAIQKIGGWDQNFIGWGGEDDFQSVKVRQFLNWHECSAKCYHLYHERPAPDMKWYQRNLQLLQKLSVMTKEELSKYTNSHVNKNGMKNTYDNF
jgi:predicted glycosyltransferase involved in capsule biosynthesis